MDRNLEFLFSHAHFCLDFQGDRKLKRCSLSLDIFKEIESEKDVHFRVCQGDRK